ncbi:hypothetical protein SDC9_103805 [bioreactor metagenome]|uniref:Uncharacterized protein n=1 Tax=bioreactor metagenome TaxID=1076179 RepID=A0A645AW40_9ZZZZ
MHDDVRTEGVLLPFPYRVTVYALALPYGCLIPAVGSGHHGYLISNHECGIESHTELTYDVAVGALFKLLLEFEGVAVRDHAQVLLHLLGGHARAVVRYGDGARLLIDRHIDPEIVPGYAQGRVRDCPVIHLIDRVGGVRYYLSQKDLLMGVDRVDYQLHKALCLCLELLLCHFHPLLVSNSFVKSLNFYIKVSIIMLMISIDYAGYADISLVVRAPRLRSSLTTPAPDPSDRASSSRKILMCIPG